MAAAVNQSKEFQIDGLNAIYTESVNWGSHLQPVVHLAFKTDQAA